MSTSIHPQHETTSIDDMIVRSVLSAIAVAFALALVTMINGGCTSSAPPTTKRAEAAGGYASQIGDCIANNKTRAEIDACRRDVEKNWSTKDAGQ